MKEKQIANPVYVYKLESDGTIIKYTASAKEGSQGKFLVDCSEIGFRCTIGFGHHFEEVSRECKSMVSLKNDEEYARQKFVEALTQKTKTNAERKEKAKRELNRATEEGKEISRLISALTQ